MKNFMKITIGIVARLAFVAIVVGLTLGIKYLFGDPGLIVFLAVVLLAWLILGFFNDKDVEDAVDQMTIIADLERDKQDLQKEITQWRASAREFQNKLDESQRREELLQKTLREKRGEAEYFRAKYNALKAEAEERKVEVDAPAPDNANSQPARKRNRNHRKEQKQ